MSAARVAAFAMVFLLTMYLFTLASLQFSFLGVELPWVVSCAEKNQDVYAVNPWISLAISAVTAAAIVHSGKYYIAIVLIAAIAILTIAITAGEGKACSSLCSCGKVKEMSITLSLLEARMTCTCVAQKI